MYPTYAKYPTYIQMPCPFCANTADVLVNSNTDYKYPDGWKEIPIDCNDLYLPIFSCSTCNKRKESGEELQLTVEFQNRLAKRREAVQAAVKTLKTLERECDPL